MDGERTRNPTSARENKIEAKHFDQQKKNGKKKIMKINKFQIKVISLRA